MLRRRSRTPAPPAFDATQLPARYQPPVHAAIAAVRRFDELVAGLPAGPISERIAAMRPRIAAGVQAVWATADRAARVDRYLATVDADRITAELKAARRSAAAPEHVAALSARFESVQRLLNGRDEIEQRLPIAEARLDAAVARAAELALLSWVGEGDFAALDAQLDSAVVELEALGAAVAELR